MKKIAFLVSFLINFLAANAQVGINTTSPSNNAALDINSRINATTYGGLMPPKITLAQRNAIAVTAADDGLIAFVTMADGSRCLQLYNGATSVWEDVKCFNASAISTPGTVFSESMGTTGSTSTDIPVNTHNTNAGFDNDSFTFSSTSASQSEVRNTSPSPTASGASGLGNVFMTTGTRDFLIENINATTYTSPLTLKLWIYKSATTGNGSELTIEYYDGATSSWTNVSISDFPTGAGTATWYDKTLSTTVPNTITKIRFSRTTGSNQFRLDDIKLIKP